MKNIERKKYKKWKGVYFKCLSHLVGMLLFFANPNYSPPISVIVRSFFLYRPTKNKIMQNFLFYNRKHYVYYSCKYGCGDTPVKNSEQNLKSSTKFANEPSNTA